LDLNQRASATAGCTATYKLRAMPILNKNDVESMCYENSARTLKPLLLLISGKSLKN
jgi:hypothetical protein